MHNMLNSDNNNSTMQNYAAEVDNVPSWKQGQNLVPVMLAHLNRYGEDLKIWGIPARMVTFLAIVDEVDVVSTKVNFKFHDETGCIRGMKWLDAETTSYECKAKIQSYARVHGTMRRQSEENYVLVLNIQPVEHLNELCVHLMEVTLMCLHAENRASQITQNHAGSTNIYNSSVSAGPSINNEVYGDLNRDQILVLDIISHGHPEDGAERSTIKSHVPQHLIPKVDEILDFLSSEGHIYTTKTDNHFKKI